MKIDSVYGNRPTYKTGLSSTISVMIRPENDLERAILIALEAGVRTVHVSSDYVMIESRFRRTAAERK